MTSAIRASANNLLVPACSGPFGIRKPGLTIRPCDVSTISLPDQRPLAPCRLTTKPFLEKRCFELRLQRSVVAGLRFCAAGFGSDASSSRLRSKAATSKFVAIVDSERVAFMGFAIFSLFMSCFHFSTKGSFANGFVGTSNCAQFRAAFVFLSFALFGLFISKAL